MAKQVYTPGKTVFHNIKVSDVIIMDCRDDIPNTELAQITDFLELSDEGVKVSFGAKTSKSGYSVAVTLPVPGTEKDGSCASFWSGERYEAFEKAYIATFMFEGAKKGWDYAAEMMEKHEKAVMAQLAAMRAERRK